MKNEFFFVNYSPNAAFKLYIFDKTLSIGEKIMKYVNLIDEYTPPAVVSGSASVKKDSYKQLCGRARAALTAALAEIERCAQSGERDSSYAALLYGEKENLLGALTKCVALLAKLAETEASLKKRTQVTPQQDNSEITEADIALLRRYLSRIPETAGEEETK